MTSNQTFTYQQVAEELVGELEMFREQLEGTSKNALHRVFMATMEYPLNNTQYKENSQYSDEELSLLNSAIAIKEKFGVLHVLALAEQQQDELNKGQKNE